MGPANKSKNTIDLDHYHKDGATLPFDIPMESLEALRRAYANLINNNVGKVGQVNFSLFNTDNHPLKMKIEEDWLALLNIPEIFDRVEQILGPDIAAYELLTFRKNTDDHEVGWHQGGLFWPIVPLEAVTVWIALDDATKDNGCLQYLPGSHIKKILYPHQKSELETLPKHIPDGILQFDEVKTIEVKSGQAIIFEGPHLVHRSLENVTGHPRRAVVLRLMPTTSYWDRKLAAEMDKKFNPINYLENTPLRLMQGRDVCGLNEFQKQVILNT